MPAGDVSVYGKGKGKGKGNEKEAYPAGDTTEKLPSSKPMPSDNDTPQMVYRLDPRKLSKREPQKNRFGIGSVWNFGRRLFGLGDESSTSPTKAPVHIPTSNRAGRADETKLGYDQAHTEAELTTKLLETALGQLESAARNYHLIEQAIQQRNADEMENLGTGSNPLRGITQGTGGVETILGQLYKVNSTPGPFINEVKGILATLSVEANTLREKTNAGGRRVNDWGDPASAPSTKTPKVFQWDTMEADFAKVKIVLNALIGSVTNGLGEINKIQKARMPESNEASSSISWDDEDVKAIERELAALRSQSRSKVSTYAKKDSAFGKQYQGIPLVHNKETNIAYLLEDTGQVVRVLPEHHPIKVQDLADLVQHAKDRGQKGRQGNMSLTMHKPPKEQSLGQGHKGGGI